MYFVYIVACFCKGKLTYYTGYTNNLSRRFGEHRSGKGAKYTKGKILRPIWFKPFRKQRTAMRYERYLKTHRREKMEIIRSCRF